MSKRASLACVLAALTALPAFAGEEAAWTENAADAMAAAAKDGKDLLIDFTGSDWCGWCMRLDKEVFSQEAFTAAAPKSFVLLKLDFPRERPLSEATKKQNAEWQAKFRISGYPTIVLADAAGRPYARTGYQEGGAEKYMQHLVALRKIRVQRDEALAKAQAAEGVEKAKLLDAALAPIDASLVMGNYEDVVAEIVKLDADNKAGLRNKYGAMSALVRIEAAARGKDLDGAIQLADDALKTYGDTGSAAQDILFVKSLCFYRKSDKAQAKALLEAALKAAPDGPKAEQIKMILERMFKDIK
ncbi:MAG TPA: thioredoxin family protein [Planctomycetota bacterium]|nr:thioredoxin family protein [Planctomycetota bacterium]HRR82596.1 thioredoxin family protein [Planctomycetota bacterium]HRT96402.1 thioredoxin family protein [Planctomycetota bacterium]